MKKYYQIVIAAFQILTEYRFNFVTRTLASVLTNLVLFLFWYFLLQEGVSLKSYTVSSLALYYLLAGLISSLIYFRSAEIGWEIRRGHVSLRLLKPLNYLVEKFCSVFPEKIFQILIGLVVFIILSAIGFIVIPINMVTFLIFIGAVSLAVVVNYLIYFTIGLLAFWVLEVHGFSASVSTISLLFSGTLIPLDLLPDVFVRLSYVLPFRYFVYFPIQIINGQLSSRQILTGLSVELFWLAAVYFLYLIVWKRGRKEAEAVGI